MKKILIMIMILWAGNLFGQKKILDSVAYAQWPSLEWPKLSSDGKYVMYIVKNVPAGKQTTVIQSTDGKWKKEYIGWLNNATFTVDGRHLLFIQGKDSLVRLTLGTNITSHISDVSSFSLQVYKQNEWLCYSTLTSPNTLIFKEIKANTEKSYQNVNSWKFSDDGLLLLLWQQNPDRTNTQILNWVEVLSGKLIKIWEGQNADNLILDSKHKQLAFMTSDSLWYYKYGSSGAICVLRQPSTLKDTLTLQQVLNFSKDGNRLFIYLKEHEKLAPVKESVEVWSYLDVKLQPEQNKALDAKSYSAVFDLSTYKTIRLQENSNEGIFFPKSQDASDSLALLSKNEQIMEPWSLGSKLCYGLVSSITGEKKNLKFLDRIQNVSLSAMGRYLIYFSPEDKNYYSFEIETGTIRNLTSSLDVSWMDLNRDDFPVTGPRRPDEMLWLKDDKFVLIYDRYDIWKLDPQNKEKPINLTNGYGKKNKLVFNFALSAWDGDRISKGNKLYLTALNTENKNNGYYLKQLDKLGDPEMLFMGPYVFNTNSPYVVSGSDYLSIKAKDAEVYILRRMSATQAPNFYSTTDFKTLTKLTDLRPEKNYNWYTTELHNWASLDGTPLKGILYKPENFDPNRKYPVIFQYYERKSDNLNVYITPQELCSGCQIDIPSYVSRGYLVFSVDVNFKIGYTGESVLSSVVSATNYLSKLSFVNAKKIGLQGCSGGGFETNYLVTHSNLFAAACSSSGIANFVSGYGSLQEEGYSLQRMYELGWWRIGASLWEKPQQYLQNSPVLFSDKVTTPLLLMHTKNDGICPFANIVEFFTGLRRLGKKSWMLVYSEGNHGLFGKESKDFSIRMMQYFDHYLMDKPAPKWMTNGITINKGNLDYGYDTEIKTPGPGLLIPKEQQKVDSLLTRQPITIMLE